MKTLTVALGTRSYPIHIGEGILERLPELLVGAGIKGSVVVVTDSNVESLYARRVAALLGSNTATCTLPAGEEHKRLEQIEWLCGRFLEAGLDRSSAVVALGGGVVGDVAGFAAASFMRGISFAQVPTTIVAQVDSSVGGKTAVNHPLGKNIIGAFHQPSVVIIDMTLLVTLPDRELRAGLAEALKHGVIADEALFAFMERKADALLAKDLSALETPILRSCEIKAAIVAADEREHGCRANLNYGHTFGHAIEAASGYTRFLHGEAVALGMHAAAVLAAELGMVDATFVKRQRAALVAYGLPVSWPGIPMDKTLAAMKHDKKVQAGTIKFILPDRIGHVVQRTDVTELQACRALEVLCAP